MSSTPSAYWTWPARASPATSMQRQVAGATPSLAFPFAIAEEDAGTPAPNRAVARPGPLPAGVGLGGLAHLQAQEIAA